MSNVLLFIDGVDRTEYFKPPLRVNPGGDGIIGTASIILEQQAGGLDLRPMMDVRVFVPFNTTTNAGIAAKGRLFGGVIMKRATTNNGTIKKWTLPLWDYNIILKKSYRRAAPVYAVNLSADTLDDQIVQLFAILQGASPTVQIDVVSGIALTTAMPAVTYPGGHRWEWYLQSLLRQAHIEDPAVFPAYYMSPGTTFGAVDTFGPPMLNVYDAASPPASVVAFSDTPVGAEKSVFEYLTRDTDATALGQTKQSWWNGAVFSAQDATSISNYPNPYDDNGQGWVDGEVINDTTSGSADEAQAAVDALVRAVGAPRDGFKWVTYERLIPGEYVDLKWDLEGIPSSTQYRVAAATFEWEEPNVIKSTLTINTRRLGLFDDGTTGFFAPPIEGDNVPPLPAADFTVASNVYNLATFLTDVTFDIDNTGGSPDTAGYKIIGGLTAAEVQTYDVGLNLAPVLSLRPGLSYSFRVYAYDNSGNLSEAFPVLTDPPLSFTTAVPNVTAPTGFQVDTGAAAPFVNGFNHINDYQVFAALEWTPTFALPSYGWYDLRFWDTADPTHKTTVTVPYNATTANIGPLFVGLTYDAEIQPMLPHYPGGIASLTAFAVPTWTGIAPVLGTITPHYAPGEYSMFVPITHAGDHSGGGWVIVSRTGGFDITHHISAGAIWPHTATIKNLAASVLYTIEVYVFDALGRRSPSDTATYTIPPNPSKPTPILWDEYHPDLDPLTRGLENVGTDGTYTFDDTTPYAGSSTLKLTLTNGTLSVMLPEQYALQEGEQRAISVAVMGDSPVTTGAKAQWVYFDDTDTEIGGRDDIFNDFAPAVFPDPPIEKQTSTAPATVKYARILLEASDTAANSVWFSRPVVAPLVPSTGIKDGAVNAPQLAASIDLASNIRLGSAGGTITIGGGGTDKIIVEDELDNEFGGIIADGDIVTGDAQLRIDIVDGSLLLTTSQGVQLGGGLTLNTGNLISPNTNVLGSAITDPATDGYLYIPQIDAPPTGVPTNQGSTVPVCMTVDIFTGDITLWAYDFGNTSWRSRVLT